MDKSAFIEYFINNFQRRRNGSIGIDGTFSDNEGTSPFPQSNYFLDGWNIFDQLVISASWIVYPLLALRTFRIVRSLRLATSVKDLQYMVKALLASVPKMLCICFLLALQFYTFKIVFTDLFEDGYASADYFGSLDMTQF
jgi:hypothetical protein